LCCRLQRDGDFFRSRISKIDQAAGLGEYIVRIVDEKKVVGVPERLSGEKDEGQAPPQVNAALEKAL